MKRLFDLLVSATLLGLLAPLILAVALLMRVAMGRPVLFAQKGGAVLGGRTMVYAILN